MSAYQSGKAFMLNEGPGTGYTTSDTFRMEEETARELYYALTINDQAAVDAIVADLKRRAASAPSDQTHFAISPATQKEFADDPETASWTVHTKPSAILDMPPARWADFVPVTDRTDNNSVEKAIQRLFAEFGNVSNAADGYTVVFNRADAGKMMMQSGVDMRTFAPQLKSLFESSVHSFDMPQLDMHGHKYRTNVIGFRYYINKVRMPDGSEAFIRFTVREETDGRNGVHAATVSDVNVYKAKDAIMSGPAYKSGGIASLRTIY